MNLQVAYRAKEGKIQFYEKTKNKPHDFIFEKGGVSEAYRPGSIEFSLVWHPTTDCLDVRSFLVSLLFFLLCLEFSDQTTSASESDSSFSSNASTASTLIIEEEENASKKPRIEDTPGAMTAKQVSTVDSHGFLTF